MRHADVRCLSARFSPFVPFLLDLWGLQGDSAREYPSETGELGILRGNPDQRDLLPGAIS